MLYRANNKDEAEAKGEEVDSGAKWPSSKVKCVATPMPRDMWCKSRELPKERTKWPVVLSKGTRWPF